MGGEKYSCELAALSCEVGATSFKDGQNLKDRLQAGSYGVGFGAGWPFGGSVGYYYFLVFQILCFSTPFRGYVSSLVAIQLL